MGNFGATTILRRFGKWNNALKAAGLSINNRQDITDEELFENLAAVWTKLGKQPFGRHMSDKFSGSEFSLGTYEKRFGSWNNSLVAFGGYIAGTGSETQKLIPNSKTRTADGNSTPRNVNWRLRAKILIRTIVFARCAGTALPRMLIVFCTLIISLLGLMVVRLRKKIYKRFARFVTLGNPTHFN
ncbi:homing endonuclease associated repeat-containing protein [Parasphingorhabdus sp. DH2-15]|uniref:homing endonuclease associated repeat-containing protein n=1 Tax=Parasphingorhabdus sp. DH2-15 TaxID=3444112 RepID=UPI003F683C29